MNRFIVATTLSSLLSSCAVCPLTYQWHCKRPPCCSLLTTETPLPVFGQSAEASHRRHSAIYTVLRIRPTWKTRGERECRLTSASGRTGDFMRQRGRIGCTLVQHEAWFSSRWLASQQSSQFLYFPTSCQAKPAMSTPYKTGSCRDAGG